MAVDYDRITAIIEELRPLDEYQAYYVKDAAQCECVAPLMPPIPAILRNAFACSRRVLDVGCGNGHTLLDGADLLEWGVGLDESADHMLAIASAQREARGIRNVEFRCGKAIALPFPGESFDLVFSERGPLGHHDGTLAEALRVLRRGGLILVETGGDFGTLQTERDRFERQGVEVQIAAAFVKTLVFPDCYEFFRYYCASWSTYAAARGMEPADRAVIDKVLAGATNVDGALCVYWQGILVGGRKHNDAVRPSGRLV